MSIRIAAIALLLIAPSSHAADGSTAFIRGGLSSVGFKSDAPGARLEADRGGGLNLSGGLRLDNGFAVRADFVGSTHDGGTACISGGGCGSFDDDLELGEGRLVFLYAPMLSDTVGLEVGGGFESVSAEVPSLDYESKSGGLVLEGALVFLRGDTFRFRLGLALLGLEDDETNEDVSGGELSAGFIADVGSVDLGAMIRGLHLEGDDPDSAETDVGELRLTIGTTWGL